MVKSLTVSQAKKIVLKRSTDEERIINDVLHFGLERPYVEKSIAEQAGITDAEPNINPLYVFVNEEQITTVLKYLLKTDGYLSM